MRGLRGVLVLLIILATVGFAIGVAVEKSSADEPHSDETTTPEGSHEEGEASGEGTAEGHTEGDSSEIVLGLNLESTPLVVAAVVFSLILAATVLARPQWRPLLVVVALAMLAFAVLDIAEVSHELDVSRAGVAIIAWIVAGLHLAAAGTSATMLGAPTSPL